MTLQKGIGILGTGSYIPEKLITNQMMEQMVDTSDEWITSRTGIKNRHFAAKDEATSDLAFIAAQRALEDAGIEAMDLDMIIVATVTPDTMFPSTACILQNRLGAKKAQAFDLSAACAGFIYGLSLAYEHILCHKDHYVLVIGAECLSRILNKNDRSTLVLFGDGAGAAVVGSKEGAGILSFDLGADGSGGDLLCLPGGGSRLPLTHELLDEGKQYLYMNGKEVYKFAVKIMDEAAHRALAKAGYTTENVDKLIPHQANVRIIDGANKRLKIDEDKIFVNLDKYGNMSAASIPVALDEAHKSGWLKEKDTLVLVGFGAGLTWGACVMEW